MVFFKINHVLALRKLLRQLDPTEQEVLHDNEFIVSRSVQPTIDYEKVICSPGTASSGEVSLGGTGIVTIYTNPAGYYRECTAIYAETSGADTISRIWLLDSNGNRVLLHKATAGTVLNWNGLIAMKGGESIQVTCDAYTNNTCEVALHFTKTFDHNPK